MNRKDILNKCRDYIQRKNLSQLDYIFQYDSVDIAKRFIKDTMGLDTEKVPFKDIKNSVCEIMSHMKIEFPDEEIEFYNVIYDRVLFLRSLPKKEYEILDNKVKMLYKKIDGIRKQIESKENKIREEEEKYSQEFKDIKIKIKRLQSRCKPHKEELKQQELIATEVFPRLDYDGRKCKHYKQLLEEELEEIQKIDLKIKALSICSGIESGDYKYKYYISPLEDNEELFSPDCDYSVSIKFAKELSEFLENIENKFYFDKEKYSEAISRYQYQSDKIENLRNNSMKKYQDFLEDYIEKRDVCNYIIENIKNNHVLNRRAEVLLSALDSYKSKQYLVFINIVAIQIEGIFYDYCSQIDIMPERMDSYGLNSKLNILRDNKVFDAYEYFAFEFPLIRNKVAHGLMTNEASKEEIKKIALEILLDLQYLIFNFQTNKKLPYYAPLEFVKSYKNADNSNYAFIAKCNKSSAKAECLYAHLKSNKYTLVPRNTLNNLQWILNPMYHEVYEFYRISKEHKEIREQLLSLEFIQFISDRIDNRYTEQKLQTYYDDIIFELERWMMILKYMICYCKDNNLSEILDKVVSLKKSTEDKIKNIKTRSYNI